jgi:hypothetical protein
MCPLPKHWKSCVLLVFLAAFLLARTANSQNISNCSTSFTYTIGGPLPQPQSCQVAPFSSFTINKSAYSPTGQPISPDWFDVKQIVGTPSSSNITLQTSIAANSLGAGQYLGGWTITYNGITTGSASVMLSVTSQPVVSVSPTNVIFNYYTGDPAPSQTLQVTSTTPVGFTISSVDITNQTSILASSEPNFRDNSRGDQRYHRSNQPAC